MDISVVIPAHEDDAGLYFTATAALAELDGAWRKYEVIAVVDGKSLDSANALYKSGAIRLVEGNFGGPQNARHAGLLAAKGEHVFFLDSHVVPCFQFFTAMFTAIKHKAGIVFSPHYTYDRNAFAGAYGLNWDGNLWSIDHETKPQSESAYRVAMMGHGGFCVNREKYLKVGGYWDAQRGWGGEETYLTLKMWMMGETCWCDPRVYHWHYMGSRRTAEVFKSVGHVRNFFLATYALGGQDYLDRCYSHYSLTVDASETFDPYREAYEAAPIEAAEERKFICSGPFGGDLGKLRKWFKSEGIPH